MKLIKPLIFITFMMSSSAAFAGAFIMPTSVCMPGQVVYMPISVYTEADIVEKQGNCSLVEMPTFKYVCQTRSELLGSYPEGYYWVSEGGVQGNPTFFFLLNGEVVGSHADQVSALAALSDFRCK